MAIEAGDRLSVTVGGQTLIRGALLDSRTGNLFLETGTLRVEDMFDHDTGRRFGLTLGLNGDWGGSGDQPAGGTVSGSYAAHDRERVDRGTIGAGTIVLRDPAQQVQDLAAINRDPSRAQAITRDRREGVDFYGSSSAVREIGSGFAGTRQGLSEIGRAARDGFKDLPAHVQAVVTDVAHQLDLAGKTLQGAVDAVIDALVTKGYIPASEADEMKKVAAQAALDDAEYAKLASGAGCGKQGFNLHDLLFTPAHAQAAIVVNGCVRAFGAAAAAIASKLWADQIVRSDKHEGKNDADQNTSDASPRGIGDNGPPPDSPNIDPVTGLILIILSTNRVDKIFCDREGHISDTPENRALLLDVANDPKTALGSDVHGNMWSARILPDGTQVWTQTRNGQLWNGGVNRTPLSFDPKTGLSSPTRPGWK